MQEVNLHFLCTHINCFIISDHEKRIHKYFDKKFDIVMSAIQTISRNTDDMVCYVKSKPANSRKFYGFEDFKKDFSKFSFPIMEQKVFEEFDNNLEMDCSSIKSKLVSAYYLHVNTKIYII